MKRTLLFTLLAASLFSCKKEDKATKPLPDPNTMQYKLSPIKEQVIYRRTGTSLYLYFEHVKGKQERLDLSLEGLPEGVTSTFDLNSGFPSFNTGIAFFVAKDAPAGTYNDVILNAISASGDTQRFNIPLTILPVKNCADIVDGSYWAHFGCAINPNDIESTRFKLDKPGTVSIEFPYGYVIADVDCVNDMLYVQKQTVNGYTIEGSGPFYDNPGEKMTADIYYTVTDAGGETASCSVHFTKM